ncbi:LytTR family transcriptional regulator DNA-binding domain-containing protein [Macrococcus armenti]|uniref:LytTR family transcriptional regulator DNA-binding domain-containing protein n=1 Tax=Macrococcus armenti TaxID=2875764 RepID=UPI001CD39A38|nr:LytTR family transcriptional regulator DNA-binding domain-containing protein [Macrococcus armenti]UBH11168.1 LytTR family transcriptional regulator DNA-binding domain-containing protein [Macrococcus armenti]
MKFKFVSNIKQDEQLVKIITHPNNEKEIRKLLGDEKYIQLIDYRTNSYVNTSVREIECITSFTHVSKVKLIDNKEYLIKGRLKELEYLKSYKMFRINNQQIININKINNYSIDKGSRIVIGCVSGSEYRVSRHYAKAIKEELTCGII